MTGGDAERMPFGSPSVGFTATFRRKVKIKSSVSQVFLVHGAFVYYSCCLSLMYICLMRLLSLVGRASTSNRSICLIRVVSLVNP